MILPTDPILANSCVSLFKEAVLDENFDCRQYLKQKPYLTSLSRMGQITVLSWFRHYVTVDTNDQTWTVRPMVKWKLVNGHYDSQLNVKG